MGYSSCVLRNLTARPCRHVRLHRGMQQLREKLNESSGNAKFQPDASAHDGTGAQSDYEARKRNNP